MTGNQNTLGRAAIAPLPIMGFTEGWNEGGSDNGGKITCMMQGDVPYDSLPHVHIRLAIIIL